jgi:hypothetical protein
MRASTLRRQLLPTLRLRLRRQLIDLDGVHEDVANRELKFNNLTSSLILSF